MRKKKKPVLVGGLAGDTRAGLARGGEERLQVGRDLWSAGGAWRGKEKLLRRKSQEAGRGQAPGGVDRPLGPLSRRPGGLWPRPRRSTALAREQAGRRRRHLGRRTGRFWTSRRGFRPGPWRKGAPCPVCGALSTTPPPPPSPRRCLPRRSWEGAKQPPRGGGKRAGKKPRRRVGSAGAWRSGRAPAGPGGAICAQPTLDTAAGQLCRLPGRDGGGAGRGAPGPWGARGKAGSTGRAGQEAA